MTHRRRRPAAAMMTPLLAVALLLAACADDATGTSGRTSTEDGTLTVFVAASLTDVAEQVSQASGLEVTISAAGSSDLVSQILAGAPADLLVTADEATMARATEAGAVEEPEVIALNHPALVVPAGNPAGITALDASLDGAALVLCAPQVPCGAAAADLAELADVELDPVSEAPNVTDVLGSVISGEADAGIVYASDVVRAGDAVEEVAVAEAGEVTNAYPAAVVAGTPRPEAARQWLDALTGDPGRQALTEAGFTLP